MNSFLLSFIFISFLSTILKNMYDWIGHGDCYTSPYKTYEDFEISSQRSQAPKKKHSSPPFLRHHVLVRPHHQLSDTKVWQPDIAFDQAKNRGFSTVGTMFFTAMADIFTWALEYKLQGLQRVLMYDLGIGRFSKQKHSPENTYQAIINCSSACYIKKESGNLEMYDTILPQQQTTDNSCSYQKITLALDHENMRCTCARIRKNKSDHLEEEVMVLKDPNEVGNLAFMMIASKSHVHTHWFANGVEETSEYWSLAKQSSKMTQSMNLAAIFSSPMAVGVSRENLTKVLWNNVVVEGLPLHHHMPSIVQRNSRTHLMTTKARQGLRILNIPPPYAETIIAATLMHSADHYYCDLFFGYDGKSKFMKSDFTIFRLTLTPPNSYATTDVLCRQHLNDPVISVIYKSAYEVDPIFAEEALFITVAN